MYLVIVIIGNIRGGTFGKVIFLGERSGVRLRLRMSERDIKGKSIGLHLER